MKPCSLHSNGSGVQASEHMLACLPAGLVSDRDESFPPLQCFPPSLPSSICVSVLSGPSSVAHSFPLCTLAQCRGLPSPIRVPVPAGLSGGAQSELRLPRMNLERSSSPAANLHTYQLPTYRFFQSCSFGDAFVHVIKRLTAGKCRTLQLS